MDVDDDPLDAVTVSMADLLTPNGSRDSHAASASSSAGSSVPGTAARRREDVEERRSRRRDAGPVISPRIRQQPRRGRAPAPQERRSDSADAGRDISDRIRLQPRTRRPAAPQAPPVGDASYHLNEFSITLGKRGASVPSGQLQRLQAWADWVHAVWYAMALEWGNRQQHLHVQVCLAARCFMLRCVSCVCVPFRAHVRSPLCRLLSRCGALGILRASRCCARASGTPSPLSGETARSCASCRSAPTRRWTYMLGYIQKSRHQDTYQACPCHVLGRGTVPALCAFTSCVSVLCARYLLYLIVSRNKCLLTGPADCVPQILTHGVSDDDLDVGRAAYNAVRVDYAEGRIQLTKSNLFKQMYKFWRAGLKPLDPFPDRMLQWMLQSGEYIPSPVWIISGTGRGMNLQSACAMWRIIRHPEATRLPGCPGPVLRLGGAAVAQWQLRRPVCHEPQAGARRRSARPRGGRRRRRYRADAV